MQPSSAPSARYDRSSRAGRARALRCRPSKYGEYSVGPAPCASQERKVAGHALETLLIVPPKGTIPAERLLLIGLGDRKTFTPELMQRVGAVEMHEALRLGVTALTHASDLKDDGMDSPTAAVARAVIAGNLAALRTQRERNAGAPASVHSLTLLSGPAFFADTRAAATELLVPDQGKR